MAGRFEGLSDLEWKLFEDIFPETPKKRSLRYASYSISLCVEQPAVYINNGMSMVRSTTRKYLGIQKFSDERTIVRPML